MHQLLKDDTPRLGAKTSLRKAFYFVWPDTLGLQIRVLCCLALLLTTRVILFCIPMFFRRCINALSAVDSAYDPIGWIIGYGCLKLGKDLVEDTRSFLWLKVSNRTRKTVSVYVFTHLHNLSIGFHLTRKTGEVLRVMDRGKGAISTVLDLCLFNIAPTLLDLLIVAVYFLLFLHWAFSLIVLSTIVMYIMYTLVVTEWRTKFRKAMVDRESAISDRAVDSLLNFETVKYFNAEAYEARRLGSVLDEYNEASTISQATLVLLNAGQNMCISVGLLAGMLFAAKEVVAGRLTPGDFVMVNAYILQLYSPLSWLGTSYRMISQAVTDMYISV